MKNKNIITHVLMMTLAVCCIVPFLILISSSLTRESILVSEGYGLFPRGFTLAAYKYVLSGSVGKIFRGYFISAVVTISGTIISLIITIMFAYPLSRKDLPFRSFFMFVVFFTMLFNGGLVPSYMMWTQTFHIKNSILALIIPNLMMNAFYIILMRTYFTTNIPVELLEAGRIDGAREFSIFLKIVLPLSKPMMATIGFMTALGYWNDWQNGLYYITDTSLYSIQNILNRMVSDAAYLTSAEGARFAQMSNIEIPSVGMRMAVAVLGMIPILIAYPFFQRFLVQGITLGGVKG